MEMVSVTIAGKHDRHAPHECWGGTGCCKSLSFHQNPLCQLASFTLPNSPLARSKPRPRLCHATPTRRCRCCTSIRIDSIVRSTDWSRFSTGDYLEHIANKIMWHSRWTYQTIQLRINSRTWLCCPPRFRGSIRESVTLSAPHFGSR